MKIVQLDRGRGKTTQLIDWLHFGQFRHGYPFWTRIIITPDINQADMIRSILHKMHDQDTGVCRLEKNPCTHDPYRWVFSWDEWLRVSLGRSTENIEVAIDNVDMLLRMLIRGKGRLKILTLTNEE